MANPKRTVLGVEIGAREVRMVEMRGGGAQPQILKAGFVPLPPGAMDGDRIVQVEVVADLIRGLHNRLNCQARAAVVGMGVQSVVSRIFSIPRVPDAELRTVVEGELTHYQILQAGTAAFDYFRLDASTFNSDALPSVQVMAVDERIAQGYRLTIEKAGLQLLALEPITLALYRAAFPMIETEPAALCLAITPQRSELSIVDHTHLRLSRRVEIGSNDFIVGRKTGAGSPGGPVNLGGESTADLTGGRSGPRALYNEEDTAELNPGGLAAGTNQGGTGPLGSGTRPLGSVSPSNVGDIIPQAAAALANEVQRSLDYYRREFPNSTAIGRVILTTNDPEAERVSEWLQDALRMDVRVVETPTDPSLPPQTVTMLEPPQGLRFLGAAGLALHALTPDWKQVPRFNLATAAAAGGMVPVERDRLTASMIISVCILFGGLFFAFLYNRSATIEQHRVDSKKNTLIGSTKDYNAKLKDLQEESVLAGIIKTDNLPVPGLMDVITGALPKSGIGLTNVTIDRKGKITLEGNARTLLEYLNFDAHLHDCSEYLVPPRVVRLDTMGLENGAGGSSIVRFNMETALKGTQAAQEMLSSRTATQ